MLNAKLVVVGGGTEGDEFQLTFPSILGRSRTASIPLPHPLISRRHCELTEQDGNLYVRDLGSTNGTFVGSERVDAASVLEHGDLLTIGTVTFRAQFAGVPLDGLDGDSSVAGTPIPNLASSGTDTSTLTRIDTGNVPVSKPSVPRVGQKAK